MSRINILIDQRRKTLFLLKYIDVFSRNVYIFILFFAKKHTRVYNSKYEETRTNKTNMYKQYRSSI